MRGIGARPPRKVFKNSWTGPFSPLSSHISLTSLWPLFFSKSTKTKRSIAPTKLTHFSVLSCPPVYTHLCYARERETGKRIPASQQSPCDCCSLSPRSLERPPQGLHFQVAAVLVLARSRASPTTNFPVRGGSSIQSLSNISVYHYYYALCCCDSFLGKRKGWRRRRWRLL